MQDTSWFVHDRFGMFIHWGLYAVPARHEWVKSHEGLTDDHYNRYFPQFDPDLYDPHAWAQAAADAGMRYVVITTKHHEGFCLWDTAHTDFKAPRTPAGRDLITPFVEAFRARGLKVGFYYSLIDWHHPDFTTDRFYPRFKTMSPEERAARDAGRDMSRYAAYMRAQVEELLTRFGRIDLMWFDFSYPGEHGKGRDDWQSQQLIDLVRRLQPHILVDNRLDLPNVGDFVTPEQFQPIEGPRDSSGKPLVWEACQTFSGSWGYHRDEQDWKSVEQLLWMLIDGVSKGGNLLLNVGPTARGEFDERACDRLAGLGAWMKRHARAIYGCGPAPDDIPAPRDGRYTYNPAKRRLYFHMFSWPFRDLVLDGLAGRVTFVQFLNDGSEIPFKDSAVQLNNDHTEQLKPGQIALRLPIRKPSATVPVIEIFLKEP